MTAKQLDRLLSILERAVSVAERWANKEYPESDETVEATISRAGEQSRHPESLEEYNAFEPEEDTLARFAKRLHPQT